MLQQAAAQQAAQHVAAQQQLQQQLQQQQQQITSVANQSVLVCPPEIFNKISLKKY